MKPTVEPLSFFFSNIMIVFFNSAIHLYLAAVNRHQQQQDIPRQHGYPVRCIVPGNAGARNCKFVEKVTVTDDPCHDAG
jgi:hypothetical protein